MDKAILKQYRDLLREKPKLEADIEKYRKKLDGLPAIPGVVKKSRDDFPYLEQWVPVEADCEKAVNYKRVIAAKKYRLSLCNRLIPEIEEFIANIPDSVTRQVFEKVYIDGMTYEEAGRELNYSKEAIYKRVNRHFEKCTQSTQESML